MSKKIVTVANFNLESNVYFIEGEVGDRVLLGHPLAPSVYITKSKNELDLVPPVPKSQYEKCLDYLSSKKHLLDYNASAVVDSLCLYFVVYRKFTPKLKNQIARLAGIPASIDFQGNLKDAVAFVNKNKVLLDDYNHRVYTNRTYAPIFDNKAFPADARQLETIFNLAGFILAQSSNPKEVM